MDKRYKHIGVQVPEEVHFKLKSIAVQKKTTITKLLTPVINKLLEDMISGAEVEKSQGGEE